MNNTTIPSTTADTIYQIMCGNIISAKWAPGMRLVHRQLAKEFGTSNIPVVEALRRLESDGLVTSYPNAGAQVREWQGEDIREVYLAREALEGVTCRLFVENASAREKSKLSELSVIFDEACKEKDHDASRQADINLHLYIAGNYNQSARTSVLFRMVKNSCLLSATIRNVCTDEPVIGPVGAHDQLIEALQSDDPRAAEAAGKAHVRGSLGFIENVLKQKYF